MAMRGIICTLIGSSANVRPASSRRPPALSAMSRTTGPQTANSLSPRARKHIPPRRQHCSTVDYDVAQQIIAEVLPDRCVISWELIEIPNSKG